MKVYELIDNVEIQSEIRYCWYDYDNDVRIIVSEEWAMYHEIKYMYVDDGLLYVEVENDE